MIFDFLISKTKYTVLKKLDFDIKKLFEELELIEKHYQKKLSFVECFNKSKKEKPSFWGIKTIKKEIKYLMNIIYDEKKLSNQESKDSKNILSELKNILEGYKANRKIYEITYKEYSDLSILYESFENFFLILKEQNNWLKKNINNPGKFVKNFSKFEDLVKKEGIVIGQENSFINSIKKDNNLLDDAFNRNYVWTTVGYGSLMNADETMNELKSTLEKAGTPIKNIDCEFRARVTPVWVVGFKRVFNKIATRKKWETDEDIKANKTAVLNVSVSLNNRFNAVAIKLTDKEFQAIRKREKNYGITELKHVYDYRNGKKLSEKCVCVKSNVFKKDLPIDKKERLKFYEQKIKKYSYGFDPDKLIKTNKMPIPRYIEVIDIGVRKLDGLLGTIGMYENYLKTTYYYYIDKKAKKDYGEIPLIEYYKLIGREIRERLNNGIL